MVGKISTQGIDFCYGHKNKMERLSGINKYVYKEGKWHKALMITT